MKSKSTIRKRIRLLRAFIDAPDSDPVAKRVAWSVEQALRWATEEVRGWPNQVEDCKGTADLIRQDLRSNQ